VPNEEVCKQCRGDDQVHIEGEILKKQKRGDIKAYWFVLLGKELYCKCLTPAYKKRKDTSHKEMQSLVGVHVKDEGQKEENGELLFPFMLIFPNKSRIYYLKSEVGKLILGGETVLVEGH